MWRIEGEVKEGGRRGGAKRREKICGGGVEEWREMRIFFFIQFRYDSLANRLLLHRRNKWQIYSSQTLLN